MENERAEEEAIGEAVVEVLDADVGIASCDFLAPVEDHLARVLVGQLEVLNQAPEHAQDNLEIPIDEICMP